MPMLRTIKIAAIAVNMVNPVRSLRGKSAARRTVKVIRASRSAGNGRGSTRSGAGAAYALRDLPLAKACPTVTHTWVLLCGVDHRQDKGWCAITHFF
jgi:hypothetical protein